jgi:ethanolamine utilization protein EutP (predicted NTPase)
LLHLIILDIHISNPPRMRLQTGTHKRTNFTPGIETMIFPTLKPLVVFTTLPHEKDISRGDQYLVQCGTQPSVMVLKK